MVQIVAAFFGYWVVETEHVPGEKNVFHDGLSRGTRPEELGVPQDEIMTFVHEKEMIALMAACDPRKEIGSVSDFLSFWEECRVGVEWLREHRRVGTRR
jgi:hypothetical protein